MSPFSCAPRTDCRAAPPIAMRMPAAKTRHRRTVIDDDSSSGRSGTGAFRNCPGNPDLSALNGGEKGLIIQLRLVGVLHGEIGERLRSLRHRPAVPANPACISGSGVAPRQQLAG